MKLFEIEIKKDEYNEGKRQVWLNVNDNFYFSKCLNCSLLHGLARPRDDRTRLTEGLVLPAPQSTMF